MRGYTVEVGGHEFRFMSGAEAIEFADSCYERKTEELIIVVKVEDTNTWRWKE